MTLNVGHYSEEEETDHATQRPDPRFAADAPAKESHPARNLVVVYGWEASFFLFSKGQLREDLNIQRLFYN